MTKQSKRIENRADHVRYARRQAWLGTLNNGSFRYPISARLCVLLGALLIGLCVHEMVVVAAVIALTAHAMASIRAALRALSLLVIIKFLNPELVTFPEATFALMWIAVLAASGRILAVTALHKKVIFIIFPIMTFGAVCAFLSIMTSVALTVSILKAFVFAVIASACVSGFISLDEAKRQQMLVWFGSLVTVVIVLSIPTFLIDNIGFAVNGHGFQGIFNQPQAFGVFIAPVFVWLITNAIHADTRATLSSAIVIALVGISLLMSLSRNAVIAASLAIAGAAMLAYVAPRSRRSVRTARMLGLAIGSCSILLIALALVPELSDSIAAFIWKGTRGVDLETAFSESRGDTIGQQFQNFLDSPWIGHGFGVYPSGIFPSGVIEIWGVPVSGAVEKHFIVTMVLEETGLVGITFFSYLMVYLIRRVIVTADIRWIGVFISCLATNIGEGTLLAPGGLGLYIWLLIGLAIAAPDSGGTSRMKAPLADRPRPPLWRPMGGLTTPPISSKNCERSRGSAAPSKTPTASSVAICPENQL